MVTKDVDSCNMCTECTSQVAVQPKTIFSEFRAKIVDVQHDDYDHIFEIQTKGDRTPESVFKEMLRLFQLLSLQLQQSIQIAKRG